MQLPSMKSLLRTLITILSLTPALHLQAQDDPLDYERALKQHQMKIFRYAQSLGTQSPTASQLKFDVTSYSLDLTIDAPPTPDFRRRIRARQGSANPGIA